MSRNQKIVFTISVLLNVLLIGAFGGLAVDRLSRTEFQKSRFVQRELSPESREAVQRVMEEKRRTLGPVIDEMRDARREVFETLSAEDFDPAAYMAAIERMAEAQNRVLVGRARATMEMAQELPAADRRKMAAQMRRHEHAPKSKFGKKFNGDGPQRDDYLRRPDR